MRLTEELIMPRLHRDDYAGESSNKQGGDWLVW